jgi:hypothetical protein
MTWRESVEACCFRLIPEAMNSYEIDYNDFQIRNCLTEQSLAGGGSRISDGRRNITKRFFAR